MSLLRVSLTGLPALVDSIRANSWPLVRARRTRLKALHERIAKASHDVCALAPGQGRPRGLGSLGRRDGRSHVRSGALCNRCENLA